MNLMDEDTRMNLLSAVDVFTMMKTLHEEGFEIQRREYLGFFSMEYFFVAMQHLQERYPYFNLRRLKCEHSEKVGLTPSLPHCIKHLHKEVKKKFKDAFEDTEVHYSEMIVSYHYNELHIEVDSYVKCNELLTDFLKILKHIDKRVKEWGN